MIGKYAFRPDGDSIGFDVEFCDEDQSGVNDQILRMEQIENTNTCAILRCKDYKWFEWLVFVKIDALDRIAY